MSIDVLEELCGRSPEGELEGDFVVWSMCNGVWFWWRVRVPAAVKGWASRNVRPSSEVAVGSRVN